MFCSTKTDVAIHESVTKKHMKSASDDSDPLGLNTEAA